jgi:hypothetical protein
LAASFFFPLFHKSRKTICHVNCRKKTRIYKMCTPNWSTFPLLLYNNLCTSSAL